MPIHRGVCRGFIEDDVKPPEYMNPKARAKAEADAAQAANAGKWRPCVVCGAQIPPERSRNAKTCSAECGEALRRETTRRYEIAHRGESRAKRRVGNMRKTRQNRAQGEESAKTDTD